MTTTRVAVWCSPEQAGLAARVVALGDMELAGVCTSEAGHGATLAAALGAEAVADPRQLGVEPPADVIWLAADADLPADSRRLLGQRARLCATSVQPATLADLASPDAPCEGCRPLLGTALENAVGEELFAPVGRPLAAMAMFNGPAELGGLAARLIDVADLLMRCMGLPETVACIVSGPDAQRAGDGLRKLSGAATLHMRFADGRSMTAMVECGPWRRALRLIGDEGAMELHDGELRWTDGAGRLLDRQRIAGLESPEQEIAEALRGVGGPPVDWPPRLAICEAARLSMRTGAPESPGRLLQAMSPPWPAP